MSRARKSPPSSVLSSFVVSSSVVLGLVVALLCAVPARAFAQAQETPARPPADPADVATIDAIISASYDVISGPAGDRDWDRERSLFHPGSRHMPTRPNERGGSNVNVMAVEAFIELSRQFYAQTGFYEYEIARTTQRFGDIAHVFSTYAWSTVKDGPVHGRGINSFHLLWDGERWWIVSVYWAQEAEDDPIPAEFLPADTVEVVGAGVGAPPGPNVPKGAMVGVSGVSPGGVSVCGVLRGQALLQRAVVSRHRRMSLEVIPKCQMPRGVRVAECMDVDLQVGRRGRAREIPTARDPILPLGHVSSPLEGGCDALDRRKVGHFDEDVDHGLGAEPRNTRTPDVVD